jgi:hypothetical protein
MSQTARWNSLLKLPLNVGLCYGKLTSLYACKCNRVLNKGKRKLMKLSRGSSNQRRDR